MMIKVVFFGASGAGKSSVIQKYVFNEFIENCEPTVGAGYVPKNITHNGEIVRLDIWDIAGPERYTILAPMFWKGSHVIVIVYDVNDKLRSYERGLIWIDYFKEQGCKIPIIFVGNKIDNSLVVSDSVVSTSVAKGQAERNGITHFHEVSAKTGQNIQELFHTITEVGLSMTDTEGPKIEEKPEWVPDSSCSKCCNCNSDFTFANRRHHCRCCGFLFCANCSSKKIPLPKFGVKKSVRVCVNCYNQESNKQT